MTVTTTARRAADAAQPRTQAPSAVPAEPPLGAATTLEDIVDLWGQDSFPASDAPANW
jgi:hypothetical protein